MSSRDKKLLIILAGVILLVVSYYFVYRNLEAEKAVIEAENDTISAHITQMEALKERVPEFESETDRMNKEVNLIVNKFPSYLQIENSIMDVVNLEENTGAYVSSMTVNPSVVIDTGYVADNGSAVSYQLYDVSSSINFDVDYLGMKKMISLIAESSNPMSVGNVTLTFDSTTGLLNGNMEFDTYFLYGQEKPYKEADIPTLEHGTDNIFGTIQFIDEIGAEGETGDLENSLVGESE